MMSSVRGRLGAAVFVSFAGVFAASGAWAASFNLTTPAAGRIDDWPTVVAVDTGFELAWMHYEPSGLSSIKVQRFAADGKAVTTAKPLAASSALIGRPRLLPAHSGKLGIVWMAMQTGINAATLDPVTGTVGPARAISLPAAAFLDVARLSNGNVAVSDTVWDKTVPQALKVRAAVSFTSPTFASIRKDAFLPGSDNPFTSPASADQAVVGDGAGGALAFFRDRADGNLHVVKVSSKGVPAAARTRVNLAKTYVGGAALMAFYGIQAVRLTDGRYAVVWTSTEVSDLSKTVIRLRWLDASGKPIGAAVQVNASAVGTSSSPRVVALAGGRLGVSWIQDEGRDRHHRVRWYAATGAASAVQTLRSDTEIMDPAGLQMTPMKDGRVLQAWRHFDATLRLYRIRGEFLTPPK